MANYIQTLSSTSNQQELRVVAAALLTHSLVCART